LLSREGQVQLKKSRAAHSLPRDLTKYRITEVEKLSLIAAARDEHRCPVPTAPNSLG
jgi:hypothetical protein